MWIFIGIIVVILVLNHIFGWSAYLGNTENLKFLENMVQDNLLLAVWTGTWNDLLLSCDNVWSNGRICCGTIFPSGQYQTDGNEK